MAQCENAKTGAGVSAEGLACIQDVGQRGPRTRRVLPLSLSFSPPHQPPPSDLFDVDFPLDVSIVALCDVLNVGNLPLPFFVG